jgi:hypothetical protein
VTLRLAGIAAVLVTAAVPAGAGAAVPTTTKLSNETTLTRFAYATGRGSIRTAPDHDAKRITRLRLVNEDGYPEPYLLLAERREGSESWVRLRVPGRPNGRTGWVSRAALGRYHRTSTAVRVNRRLRRVTVTRNGKKVMQVPVGIGAVGTATPAGRFWIRSKFRVKTGGLYGPRALGTTAYAPGLTDWPRGGVVGFHGTNQPELIPGRVSHGCIRLKNWHVMRFYRLVDVGTPVHII